MTMFKHISRKIASGARNEDGAALVVTVSVFLFIYLAILGVYAIGMNVRNRIHLQNACDAAAYSAAVVQADALSRIATLNRALSWTYCQMTKRQTDYIIYKWLEHTVSHYKSDREVAVASGSPGGHAYHRFFWIGTNLNNVDGTLDKVELNGADHSISDVESACEGFLTHIENDTQSFYDNSESDDQLKRLQRQLDADKYNIRGMNDAIAEIKGGLLKRIDDVAKTVADANLSAVIPGGAEVHIWRADPLEYMKHMGTLGEERFREFAGDPDTDGFTPPSWMALDDDGVGGFCRKYTEEGLVSKWSWWSKKWECSPYSTCGFSYAGSCPHSTDCADRCTEAGFHSAELDAIDQHDDYYDGEHAAPQELTEDYFGPAGTITVGLAVVNVNPFASVIGAISGIFSAFNPGVAKTLCFSSAKAGYCRTLGGDNADRLYSVDWNSEDSSWNLRQSDWDAVFVPVRRSVSKAIDGAWDGDPEDFLTGYAGDLGVTDGDFTANANGKWRMGRDDETGNLVNNASATLDWSNLHNRMFH